MSRTCGACSACCSVLAVDGLKPPRQVCANDSCGRGCRVYDTRPQGCRDYSCLFAETPNLPDSWRPDRLGLIFDSATEAEVGEAFLFVRRVRPLEPLSRRAQVALRALRRIAKLVPV